MRYLSLFSGIEAASVAWNDLGWEPVAFSEIEPFPCALLEYRFPEVPNLGDITKIDWSDASERLGSIDLVVGGSPCQSFSVAGKREGLDGESGLLWEYLRCISDIRPRWLLWENVPAVFSIDGGRAFGAFASTIQSLGYCVAWRVLDARYFGIPQQRKRVYAVGSLGGGGAAAVLFEPTCLSGDTPQVAGQGEASPSRAGESTQEPLCASSTFSKRQQQQLPTRTDGLSYAVTTKHIHLVLVDGEIRRLTPLECERLQGFPDGWTDIPYKGKEHPSDTARYKAIGNSFPVPVIKWIGERIVQVEKIMEEVSNG